jgi:flavin reductase (DIM6/NTAB) family NADH-FMN oxidoreductase RutF
VTIVTSLGPDGRPVGFTATAVSSLSLDPPLVLVCIARDRRVHDAVAHAPGFVINVLGRGQEGLARRFASALPDRFAGVGVRPAAFNIPALHGIIGTIECERHAILAGGDHSIFIGRVLACECTPNDPLVHLGRGFREVTPPTTHVDLGLDWLMGAPW